MMYSKTRNVFTKYGRFQIKVYRDGIREYVVMMHPNFLKVDTPLVYVYSGLHTCESNGHVVCSCNTNIDIALRVIRKEEGLIIYHNKEGEPMDDFLEGINARNIETDSSILNEVKLGIKKDGRTYNSLGFIFKDLKLSKLKLISKDPKVREPVKQLDIEIVKQAPSISFGY